MNLSIPQRLLNTCEGKPDRMEWLERLPDRIGRCQEIWSLKLLEPYDTDEVSCAWVAPVIRRDDSSAVIKAGMPHMEAMHEIQGLRFWDGDPTAFLYESDVEANIMLMERCLPGSVLRELPEPEHYEVLAAVLRRLWSPRRVPVPFRSIAELKSKRSKKALARSASCPDPGLISEGLSLFDHLLETTEVESPLATDLHAGNVLRAEREPWLTIDPKPFKGDRAYDATQHLFNCSKRLIADVEGVTGRFGDLLEIPAERIRQWLFARAATESSDDDWPALLAITRTISL